MKLNLGCGNNILSGWDNHDMDVDLTKPIPYADISVQKIFAEHVIEHLTSAEMMNFFSECYRILQPGGILRVVFPDIEQTHERTTEEYVKFARTYIPDSLKNLPMVHWHALSRCHGHKQMLTKGLIIHSLSGFPFSCISPAQLYLFNGEPVDGHHNAIGKAYHELESVAVEAIK